MRFPDHWHATLTTTEFIVHADLRGELAKLDPRPSSFCIARFGAAEAIGNDSVPLSRLTPLVLQRSQYGQCVRSKMRSVSDEESIHFALVACGPNVEAFVQVII